jgi:argininosuccinate synthase
MKIVLAYSGGLDIPGLLSCIKESYGNTGKGNDWVRFELPTAALESESKLRAANP